jgi:hypothetical protein
LLVRSRGVLLIRNRGTLLIRNSGRTMPMCCFNEMAFFNAIEITLEAILFDRVVIFRPF